ncbi:MAG: hypothetical protein EHM36_00495 [Deltaproteobacteria bacterium]|nr:MAG: hypothetical protein EHM36_00495 [Deltaproteobacteria bacterium]
MEDRMTGWRGKRRVVDLGIQRAWTEEISEEDLKNYIGGRGLNGKFFLDRVDSSLSPASPDNPLAFAVGPLSGTFAPCSGWTSVSTISPVPYSSRYGHAALPGHWGPQLKYSGFDQLIIRGKAERPVYLAIEGEQVHFEEAKHLLGKDTVETTVAIQEERKDRNIEVLCIGPAGERLAAFANVTNRFSWTGDHIGLGYVFGSKNLKAIAVCGNTPVSLHHPDRFLQTCLSLRQRIHRDPHASRLREEGSFLLLNRNGRGFGIKNYTEASQPDAAEKWRNAYLTNYQYGKEGCFSCPIHCGRITEIEGNYFGGLHFESAWSLGPRIGIDQWEKTLWLHRVCQLQGLDPCSTGSLLSWIMDCSEKGVLSSQDLGPTLCQWGDEKAARQIIESITERKGIGEILGQGCLRAAKSLGKGLEEAPHFQGMDLPARDPRSSIEYALTRALFPMEWDYLQSLSPSVPAPPAPAHPEESQGNGMMEGIVSLERRRVLADLNSICPLVAARLSLLSASDMGDLLSAATEMEWDGQPLMAAAARTMEVEKGLWQRFGPEKMDLDPFPLRLFNSPEEKNRVIQEKTNDDGLNTPWID